MIVLGKKVCVSLDEEKDNIAYENDMGWQKTNALVGCLILNEKAHKTECDRRKSINQKSSTHNNSIE